MATYLAGPATPVETTDRILQAAFDRIAVAGLTRTTMEDVARAARVSRQTVYRYFASKERLITALVLREEEAFLEGAREAFAANDDLTDALEQAILFCLRFAREHPLLDRLLATDSETLLPYLTTRGQPVIARASQVLRREIPRKAWVRADTVEAAVDALVRVIISHALSPSPRPPQRVARGLAKITALALTGSEGRPSTANGRRQSKEGSTR
jgi:AcrR family transcriptional regulator